VGITIFYHGALRDLGRLPQLTARLQAACVGLGWPCKVVNERILGTGERYRSIEIETDDGIPTSTFEIDVEPVDDHVQGVVIAPPGCETLYLTFGRTGRLIEYCAAPFGDPTPGHYGLIHEHLFTKTQFSSPEVHMQVCELLRIVEPFMAEWAVSDEGNYWSTWDEQTLRDTWARYTAILTALSDPAAIQEILKDAGVDIEVTQPPEVGKRLNVAHPLWRQEWGISAGEN
jgi:hypothetical protein